VEADKPNNLTDDDIPGFREVLQELRDEAQTRLSAHLSLETIDDYFSNRLTADDKEAIQEHLVACTECVAQTLEFMKFCNSESAELEKPHPDLAAMMWAKVQAFAPAATAAPPAPAPFISNLFNRLKVQFSKPSLVYASLLVMLATGLALAAVIFSLNREKRELIARLDQKETSKESDPATQNSLAEATKKTQEAQRQRDAEHLRADQLESQTAQLKAELSKARDGEGQVPAGNGRSLTSQGNVTVEPLPNQARGTSEMEIPAGISSFILVVEDPDPDTRYSEYAIEIRKLDGFSIVRESGLHLQNVLGTRALTISLPTKSLPAAQYRFTIYGVYGGERTLEQEQLVSIRYK
jgi:hypothetical protein